MDRDLDLVRSRLLSGILSGSKDDSGASVDPSDAEAYAKSLAPDGSWPDVNYTDRTRTGAWSPEIHVRRQVRSLHGRLSSTAVVAVAPPHLRP